MRRDWEITEESLADLIRRFYARVREDGLIGPVFNAAIDDWPGHLEKLQRFWSSVMLTTGRYKGNPLAAHLKHADQIAPEMFARWLALWREITTELMSSEAASELQAKADRIAESLQLAIRFRPGKRPLDEAAPEQVEAEASAATPERSSKPYRSTPIFDQDSLPSALRGEHRTKAGTWGAIHVLAGELILHFTDPPSVQRLSGDRPGVVNPEQTHWVEPLGPMRMRIDFHHTPPGI